MADRVLQISDGFWNVRGSFKIGGVVDIGTHASLVRRANGKFVWLDAYTLTGDTAREIDALTDGGSAIEAILNLHPFHTVHVRRAHERYPHAKLYGTARHQSKYPELPWESPRTEDAECHALFEEDFAFSVPRGVDFISHNENIHFSSVLAMHKPSNTLHVDDTLMCIKLPKLLGGAHRVSFHPTLAKALERRAGACADFRAWAKELCDQWEGAAHLCAAHTAALTPGRNGGEPIRVRIERALQKADKTLRAHEAKHG
ncbi:MAG: hypothetical protein AAF500_17785 [Myxococcota bacterium]